MHNTVRTDTLRAPMRPSKTQSYVTIRPPGTDLSVVAEHVRIREIDARERYQRKVFEAQVLSRGDTFDVDLTDLDDP